MTSAPTSSSPIDTLINTLDSALRTLLATPQASGLCATLPEGRRN